MATEEARDAMEEIAWLSRACHARNAEGERCYQVVYQALARAEDEAVISALKSIAYKIVDPDL